MKTNDERRLRPVRRPEPSPPIDKDYERRRLVAEGRWEEFCLYKVYLAGIGTPRSQLWADAIAKFEPMGVNVPDRQPTVPLEEQEDPMACVDDGKSPSERAGEAIGKKITDEQVSGSTTTREAVEWVATVLERSDVTVSEAPSQMAWSCYVWASSSPQNKSDFWRTMFSKLMPTKAQIDEDANRKGVGEDRVDAMVARLRAMDPG